MMIKLPPPTCARVMGSRGVRDDERACEGVYVACEGVSVYA